MAGHTNFPTNTDSLGDVTDNVDDVSADHVNDLRRTAEAIEVKVGIDSSGVDTSLDYKINNFFVEDTRTMWMYEATAPTGWTLQDYGDKVIAAGKTGKLYDSQAGGTNTNDWTISGITKDAHTHTDGTYTVANHVHSVYHGASGDQELTNGTVYAASPRDNAVDTGGAAPSVSGTSGPQSGNGTTSDGTWRPSAYIGIIAQFTGLP